MKIALCISGQPRMWEKGFEYHNLNIIKNNDVTVFLHSWEMPAEQMQAISAKYNAHSFITSPNPTVDLSKYTVPHLLALNSSRHARIMEAMAALSSF